MTMTPEEKLPPVSQAQPPENLALAREIALQKARRGHESPGTIQMLEAAYRNGKMDNTETVTVALLSIQATEVRMQERVRAETDWQDIATAPKDGTLIDVWRGGEFPRRVPDVSWREPTDSEWWVHGGDTIRTPAATWHDMFGPFGKDDTPTHWRPLPSPPAIRETPHAEG